MNKWLIWSNEHRAWWRPNSRGYTTVRFDAGIYGYEEAVKICESAKLPDGYPKEQMIEADSFPVTPAPQKCRHDDGENYWMRTPDDCAPKETFPECPYCPAPKAQAESQEALSEKFAEEARVFIYHEGSFLSQHQAKQFLKELIQRAISESLAARKERES